MNFQQNLAKNRSRAYDLYLPLYCWSTDICFDACCTCNNNFTLSIGATAVFETAAEIPPARKSFANDIASGEAILH